MTHLARTLPLLVLPASSGCRSTTPPRDASGEPVAAVTTSTGLLQRLAAVQQLEVERWDAETQRLVEPGRLAPLPALGETPSVAPSASEGATPSEVWEGDFFNGRALERALDPT